MDGKNDCSGRGWSSVHSLVWLPVFLCLIVASGCAGFSSLPKDLKQYLPPNEKEDVLLLCFYESGRVVAKDNSIVSSPPVTVEDVQILSYPYDDVHFGSNLVIGIGAVTWAYQIRHERYEMWLLTKKRQIIRIPLKPISNNGYDDALSKFFVATNPPLTSEDFCIYKTGDPSVRFVQGRWRSLEDARLAQKFWAECPVEENPSPVPLNWGEWDWKLHSIFGKTGDILNSRRTAIP